MGKTFDEVVMEELRGTGSLAKKFIVTPFSVLDARHESWGKKQVNWLPVFDPLLCEIVYLWHMPKRGGSILDPFGGSTRGIVAGCLGHSYTGIEPNQEQIKANERQALLVQLQYPQMKLPKWICAKPESMDSHLPRGQRYDLIFTSLPIYASADATGGYAARYKNVFAQAIPRLKQNRFVVVMARTVYGDEFIEFSPEQVTTFVSPTAARYYNRFELVMSGNIHESLVCFFKGKVTRIPEELGNGAIA
jgi:hypothetical protein